jgi:hypothetical protein
VQIDPET